eukprot:230540-Pyramimonas_sp.AAC.1
MDQIGRVLAGGIDTRWGSREHLAIHGTPCQIQHDMRCRNCDRLLSLGIVISDGTICDICWQYTVAVGATGKGGAAESDLAYLQKLTDWIKTTLSQDDIA